MMSLHSFLSFDHNLTDTFMIWVASSHSEKCVELSYPSCPADSLSCLSVICPSILQAGVDTKQIVNIYSYLLWRACLGQPNSHNWKNNPLLLGLGLNYLDSSNPHHPFPAFASVCLSHVTSVTITLPTVSSWRSILGHSQSHFPPHGWIYVV